MVHVTSRTNCSERTGSCRGLDEKTVSSFGIIKGSLISETHSVFMHWDLALSNKDNFARFSESNVIGARSASWLSYVIRALRIRFDPSGMDRPLVVLTRRQWSVQALKPLWLWRICQVDHLLRAFLLDWLFPAWERGTDSVRSTDLHDLICRAVEEKGKRTRKWSHETVERVAIGLLRMAVDFGLMEGKVRHTFRCYHLPEESFLFLLYAMSETEANVRKIIEAPEWRMYLMRPDDVEGELFRLHQYRRLEYQVAGTLSQLSVPFATALEFAEKGGLERP